MIVTDSVTVGTDIGLTELNLYRVKRSCNKMPKKICIADDQPSLRKMVRFALSVQGLDVVEAEDGLDALEKLSADKVDLIIADWQMARMDGLELLRELRKIDAYANAPVIMVSARDDLGARKEARELGAISWLKKPFKLSEIQSIVEAGLGGIDSAVKNGKT